MCGCWICFQRELKNGCQRITATLSAPDFAFLIMLILIQWLTMCGVELRNTKSTGLGCYSKIFLGIQCETYASGPRATSRL